MLSEVEATMREGLVRCPTAGCESLVLPDRTCKFCLKSATPRMHGFSRPPRPSANPNPSPRRPAPHNGR